MVTLYYGNFIYKNNTDLIKYTYNNRLNYGKEQEQHYVHSLSTAGENGEHVEK